MENTQTSENIKNLRESMGLTQAGIAAFLKLDQSYISKMEANERPLTADILEKLSALFGVTINELGSCENAPVSLSCAFRKNSLSVNDMETIAAIHQIGLNSEFMQSLLDEDTNHG